MKKLSVVTKATLVAMLLCVSATIVSAAEVPKAFFNYLPIIKKYQAELWKAEDKAFISREIHAETCITVSHKYCWSPTARFKTSREEGAGLSQITRAYDKNGNLRFDNLAGSGISWTDIYNRPDYQIYYIVRRQALCYSKWRNLDFCAAIYNSGEANLIRRQVLCTGSCNPLVWFDNVATKCPLSLRTTIYNRTACDINNLYVKKIQQDYKKQFDYEKHFK